MSFVINHHVISVLHLTAAQALIADSHFTATHENRKDVDLREQHQERQKQCSAMALRLISTKDRPSTETESTSVSKNDSEAAGTVWADSPCRWWKYLQNKWCKFQISVLKPSGAIYCLRDPQTSLWSVYFVLFNWTILKVSKTKK